MRSRNPSGGFAPALRRSTTRSISSGSEQAEQARLSRWRFVKSSALGVAGVATGIISLTAANQSQRGRDVRISGGRHEVEGGGDLDVRIEDTTHADASISDEVVPATIRAGSRHETRGFAVLTVTPKVG